MSSADSDSLWVSEQRALLLLVIISLLVVSLVVIPYLQFILLAIVLAYVLWPAQKRLEVYVSPLVAAISLTVGTMLAVLIPIAYLLLLAIQEGITVLQNLEGGQSDIQTIEARLQEFGVTVDLVEFYDDHRETIVSGIEQIVMELFGVVRTLPQLFIGLTITLFVMFALLRDGDRLLEWLQIVMPVRNEVQSEFLERIDRLMWASIIGNVGASLIQAVALGIGLAVLGFDNIILLTVATFVFALLPLVGAFIVWVPLVAYLALLDQTTAAVILFFYGSLVSLSDFYTRPLVIGKSGALNSAIVVVGVFGGIVAFGMIGLFIGPVVVGGAKISLDLYARERAAAMGEDPDDIVSIDTQKADTPVGRSGIGAEAYTDRHEESSHADSVEKNVDSVGSDTDEGTDQSDGERDPKE